MKYLLIIFYLFLSIFINAQPFVTQAQKDFERYNYTGVIQKLEGKETLLNIDDLRNLAVSYKMTFNYVKAEALYAMMISMPDKTDLEIYNYAQALKSNQKYDEAELQLANFANSNKTDQRAKLFSKNKKYYVDLLVDKKQFEIRNLEINSTEQDFGTAYYKNQIVYASSKQPINAVYRKWNGNDLSFLDLYIGNENSAKNEIIEAQKISEANKKYHEGPAAYTKKGDFVMFTRDNYLEKSSDAARKLELVEAKLDNGKWGNEIPFPINNKEYSVGHPSYSNDGNTLYFSSDMPGGKGGVDIYVIKRYVGGNWTTPQNVAAINTEGDEMFPFVYNDDVLFFASDGHPGLGGLDVFATQIKEFMPFGKVTNLGTPINSSKDDFTFILNNEQTKGYFSSNREGGKGSDDIYSFTVTKPLVFCKSIKGIVKDMAGSILAGAKVTLRDADGKMVDTTRSNDDGSFSFCIDRIQKYKLKGAMPTYTPGYNTATVTDESDVFISDLILEKDPGLALLVKVKDAKSQQPLDGVAVTIINLTDKSFDDFQTATDGTYRTPLSKNKVGDNLKYKLKYEKKGYVTKETFFNYTITKPQVIEIVEQLDKPVVGGDLAKMININPIYFDLGKYAIRPDAAIELEKIIKVMNDYPTMVVELGSHTDCRATASFNEKLSDNRAKASAEYIKKSISKPERIYGKGYGEKRLINGCACEGTVKSSCSEEEHQKNRRTEFIIKKLD